MLTVPYTPLLLSLLICVSRGISAQATATPHSLPSQETVAENKVITNTAPSAEVPQAQPAQAPDVTHDTQTNAPAAQAPTLSRAQRWFNFCKYVGKFYTLFYTKTAISNLFDTTLDNDQFFINPLAVVPRLLDDNCSHTGHYFSTGLAETGIHCFALDSIVEANRSASENTAAYLIGYTLAQLTPKPRFLLRKLLGTESKRARLDRLAAEARERQERLDREERERQQLLHEATEKLRRQAYALDRMARPNPFGNLYESAAFRNLRIFSNADAYTVLGVSQMASFSTITRAYRQRALQWHPDKNNGNDATFKLINDAYDLIKTARGF